MDKFKCGHDKSDENSYLSFRRRRGRQYIVRYCKACSRARGKSHRNNHLNNAMDKRIRYWIVERFVQREKRNRIDYYKHRHKNEDKNARSMYRCLMCLVRKDDPLYKPRVYGVMPNRIKTELKRREERKQWRKAKMKMAWGLLKAKEAVEQKLDTSQERSSEEPQ